MIEMAIPGTPAPALLRNMVYWAQAISNRRVGL